MIENSAHKNILNFKPLIAVSPTEGCMSHFNKGCELHMNKI